MKAMRGVMIGAGFFAQFQAEAWRRMADVELVAVADPIKPAAADAQIEAAKNWILGIVEEPEVGKIYDGKVVNIVDFGAFVNFMGGKDGLVHVSEMKNERVEKPTDVVSEGQPVKVKVLDIDRDRQRISLGLKQAEEDPWLKIGENYPVGTAIRGRVVRLMDKGVVVDLGNNLEGFVPMSHLGKDNIENPAEVVQEGQVVDCAVLEVDPIHHRIVVAVTGYPDEPIIPPVKPPVDEGDSEAEE